MGRVLMTGFAPFGGESVNPSWQAVSLVVPDVPAAYFTTLPQGTEGLVVSAGAEQ